MGSKLETGIVGALVALAVLGASVWILTIPAFTRTVVEWAGSAELSGLSETTTLRIAEEARRFVVTADSPELPERVEGRSGFGPRAVSHLLDVRAVLALARGATLVCAALAALWTIGSLAFARFAAMAKALRAAGLVLLGVVATAAAASVLDFDAFFAAFHGIFFEPDTWTFSADDLLVQVFPEPFWRVAAGAWGGCAVLGGASLLVLSRWCARRTRANERMTSTA